MMDKSKRALYTFEKDVRGEISFKLYLVKISHVNGFLKASLITFLVTSFMDDPVKIYFV